MPNEYDLPNEVTYTQVLRVALRRPNELDVRVNAYGHHVIHNLLTGEWSTVERATAELNRLLDEYHNG